MKAMRLGRPASLEALALALVEADAPPPGRGEIMVRLRATSLNFRDALVAGGVFPAAEGLIPLSDRPGEVIEVGQGVTEFANGDAAVSSFHPNWRDGHIDRVELNNAPGGPADGYDCEYATRSNAHFARVPKGLSSGGERDPDLRRRHRPARGDRRRRGQAWRDRADPGRGRRFAVPPAVRRDGGRQVIATASSDARLERRKALGADEVINYRQTVAGEAALTLTGGLGVDHVIEVGGPHTIGQSFVAARTGGHVAMIGAVGGFDIDTMPFAIVQAKRLRLQAVTVSSRRDQTGRGGRIEACGVRPVIDSRFPLAKLADAFPHLKSGQQFGKIVIDI